MTISTKIRVEEIPVPKGTIMVTLEKEIGPHVSRTQLFFDDKEFLEFFKPIVDYYERVNDVQSGES
jgi:hypothetical protein